MRKTNLYARIEKLKKSVMVGQEQWTLIEFEDDDRLAMREVDFRRMFKDVLNGRPNDHYEFMKQKRDQGFPDKNGIIFNLEAYDPLNYEEVWLDEKGEG